MLQHTHETAPFSAKKQDLIVLFEALQSPANIGAIFRLCDAFGVCKVISTTPVNLSSNRLKRTSRSTESKVPYEISTNVETTIIDLKQQGFKIISLEISTNSIPLQDVCQNIDRKTVLIVGNEKDGISEKLLHLSDDTVHIPMFGNNSSMNVAQATAIALYELTKH